MRTCSGASSWLSYRAQWAITLGSVRLGCFPPNLVAEELLHEGTWKGRYVPNDLGQSIRAVYEVTKGDDAPHWTVTMQLNLHSTVHDRITFDNVRESEGTLTFSLNIAGFRRDCVLERQVETEMVFKCTPQDGEEDHGATLTMRPQAVEPEPEQEQEQE